MAEAERFSRVAAAECETFALVSPALVCSWPNLSTTPSLAPLAAAPVAAPAALNLSPIPSLVARAAAFAAAAFSAAAAPAASSPFLVLSTTPSHQEGFFSPGSPGTPTRRSPLLGDLGIPPSTSRALNTGSSHQDNCSSHQDLFFSPSPAAPAPFIVPSLSSPLTSPSPSSPRALLWPMRDLKKRAIAAAMMTPTKSRQRVFNTSWVNA